MWFEEADQGMLPHPGTGNSGEPSALPPKGQRDGREWALDSGLQTELQRMVASPEHSAEWSQLLPLPCHWQDPTRKGGGHRQSVAGGRLSDPGFLLLQGRAQPRPTMAMKFLLNLGSKFRGLPKTPGHM